MNNLKKITAILWISLGIIFIAMGLSLIKKDNSNEIAPTNTNSISISNICFVKTNSDIINTNLINTNNN